MSYFNRRQFLKTAASSLVLAGAGVGAAAQSNMRPGPKDLLAVMDITYCFLPVGFLPSVRRDEVVEIINRLVPAFEYVVMSQAWPTATSGPCGVSPDEKALGQMPYGTGQLWRSDCGEGATGGTSRFRSSHVELVVRQGNYRHVRSYHALNEATRKVAVGLSGYLRERGLERVAFASLSTDFCVASAALEAQRAGFAAYLIEDAIRGSSRADAYADVWRDVARAGVRRIKSADIAA